ncbi:MULTISPECIES: hypothetical protein [Rhodomicrobium]|uniref:hypothetical protein n=1 Tax=Rhodomicrobium TaxID=1068 RepID=UPI000B4A5BC9|nr:MULTISPECIES: hypothetical protein [Rhodomicrobium]
MDVTNAISARFEAVTFILALFSVFFTIVSAYIAGLYFFLARAPLPLKMLAFFILTMSFLFLGGLAFAISDLVEVVISNWDRANIPVTDRETIRQWLFGLAGDFMLYYVGAILGWAVAFAVYLSLFYLTFFYRWTLARTELDDAIRA